MQCDDYRTRIQEVVDGEFDDAHASECASCAEELASARRDRRMIDEAIHGAVSGHNPDPAKRRAFLDGLNRPPRFRWWGGAAAAAILAGILIFVLSSPEEPTPLEAYQDALRKETEGILTGLEADPEEYFPLEQAALEEMMAGNAGLLDMSLPEAARALDSKDMVRRVAARRVLAAAPREKLKGLNSPHSFVKTLIRIPDRREDPVPSGNVTIRMSSSNTPDSEDDPHDIRLLQYENGVIHVRIKTGPAGQPVVHEVLAHDNEDLRTRHAEFCRRFGLRVKEGSIGIGGQHTSTTGSRGFRHVRDCLIQGDIEKLLDEVDEMRWDAFEETLSEERIRKIEKRLSRSTLTRHLDKLRERLSSEELRHVERLEKALRRARSLEFLRRELRDE